jgi:hypothetical protein
MGIHVEIDIDDLNVEHRTFTVDTGDMTPTEAKNYIDNFLAEYSLYGSMRRAPESVPDESADVGEYSDMDYSWDNDEGEDDIATEGGVFTFDKSNVKIWSETSVIYSGVERERNVYKVSMFLSDNGFVKVFNAEYTEKSVNRIRNEHNVELHELVRESLRIDALQYAMDRHSLTPSDANILYSSGIRY